ncbi:hypothetical protein W97_06332 [Coniosporium apollinis CBS 100218]|uniref:Uncharacterized protein n=1 Tax=Coniosporium apollinis (strain CBS 100218) TaxID=1168221 RepID=R7YYK3_CONA1|nr:uncharacterized protein W97_06332 [Coniosporium apollinis CBS 100218]EON66928.1 hypothetical protein W97_06332 [Coniosporium apollinis CBS 100218]
MRQRNTNVIKALPGLMAQLNLEVWGSKDADDKEVPLGDWVVYEKALYRKHDQTVKGLGCRVLQPDELLVLIKRAMQGLPVEIDDITSSLYNNQMKRPLGAYQEDDAMD